LPGRTLLALAFGAGLRKGPTKTRRNWQATSQARRGNSLKPVPTPTWNDPCHLGSPALIGADTVARRVISRRLPIRSGGLVDIVSAISDRRIGAPYREVVILWGALPTKNDAGAMHTPLG